MSKRNKGITLISLIVAIIVILILVGITITTLSGDNGIINRSITSMEKLTKSEIVEQLQIAIQTINIRYKSDMTQKSLTSYYTNYNDLEDSSVFVMNSKYDNESYPIQKYAVLKSESTNYVDISVNKENGNGKVYRFLIKLDNDENVNQIGSQDDNEEIAVILNENDIGNIIDGSSLGAIYNITYETNGGSLPANAIKTYKAGKSVTFPIPTYEKYVFDGWYESSDLLGKALIETPKDGKSDITLYAKWLSETDSDFFEWDFGTTATIKGFGDDGIREYNAGNIKELVIPTNYNGTKYPDKINMQVTKISAGAFDGKNKLKKVIIQDGITSIEWAAFRGCTEVEELVTPLSVALDSIDNVRQPSGAAFYNFINLRRVKIIKSNSAVFDYSNGGSTSRLPWMFAPESSVEVEIEEGVEEIPSYIFKECKSLKRCTFPSTLKRIGEGSFYNASNLEIHNIKFPKGLTKIEASAFVGCDGITGEVNFPSGITTIYSNTFAGCGGIKKVVIHDQITSIEWAAFRDCVGIEELIVPISVFLNDRYGTRQNTAAFYNSKSIKKIKFTRGNGIPYNYSASEYSFSPCYFSEQPSIEIIFSKDIPGIAKDMFEYADKCVFYYEGTSEEWASLNINAKNISPLTFLGDMVN